MDENNLLWLVTTVSMLVACSVAEVTRKVLNNIFKSNQGLTLLINFGVSSFIMIVCTYEKVILAVYNLKVRYYISTFLLCFIYGRLFLKYQPNPIAQFCNYWESSKDDNNNRLSLLYAGLLIPLVGQLIGLYTALFWLDKTWNGWLTNAHLDQQHLVSACIPCLNVGVFTGFVIELGLALFYLTLSHFIAQRSSKGELFHSQRKQSFVTATAIIILLYAFIDHTGAFSNPILAYALERRCLTGVSRSFQHFIVYSCAPIVAAYIHLSVTQSNFKKHGH